MMGGRYDNVKGSSGIEGISNRGTNDWINDYTQESEPIVQRQGGQGAKVGNSRCANAPAAAMANVTIKVRADNIFN